jgi:hypothetical protein
VYSTIKSIVVSATKIACKQWTEKKIVCVCERERERGSLGEMLAKTPSSNAVANMEAAPCLAILSPLKTLPVFKRRLLVFFLAYACTSLQNSVLVALMKQTAAHSPRYIGIDQCPISLGPTSPAPTTSLFFHVQHRHYHQFNISHNFFLG